MWTLLHTSSAFFQAKPIDFVGEPCRRSLAWPSGSRSSLPWGSAAWGPGTIIPPSPALLANLVIRNLSGYCRCLAHLQYFALVGWISAALTFATPLTLAQTPTDTAHVASTASVMPNYDVAARCASEIDQNACVSMQYLYRGRMAEEWLTVSPEARTECARHQPLAGLCYPP
jgi:hypothetical protein